MQENKFLNFFGWFFGSLFLLCFVFNLQELKTINGLVLVMCLYIGLIFLPPVNRFFKQRFIRLCEKRNDLLTVTHIFIVYTIVKVMILFFSSFIILSIVIKMTPPTNTIVDSQTPDKNVKTLNLVKTFESDIISSTRLCETSFTRAENLLKNKNYKNSYTSFIVAKNACYDASSSISKIKIPKVNKDEKKKLKESKELYKNSQSSMAYAATQYMKILDNPNFATLKKEVELEDTIKYSLKNKLEASAVLTEIEKDLQNKIQIK